MARAPKPPFSGVALGWEREARGAQIGFTSRQATSRHSKRRKLVVDESEAHVLVVAPTGSGKGRNLMIPTLLASHAPAVVVDVKGEAAAVTADARRRMGHDVHILDPFKIVTDAPDTFNPLDVVESNDLTIGDEALEIAEGIVGPDGSHRDRFWDNWARSVISAMLEFAIIDAEEPATMGQVWSRLNGDDVPYNLAVLLDSGRMTGLAYNNIAGFLGLPERETRPSVLGTVQQHIRLFGTPAVMAAMAETSFDLASLRDGRPQTLYLVVPPSKLASHAPMLRMWLWGLMKTVIQREENPPVPTLFIIDEMAHLGAMPILEQSVTLMRGYGVRLMLLLQNIGQLAKLYPNDNGTIASNCLVAATFGTSSPIMAKPMAELLGDVTAEQLLAMPDDVLALRQGKGATRFLTKLDYLKDRRFAGQFGTNPRYRSAARALQSGSRASGGDALDKRTADNPVITGFRALRDAGAEVRRLEARITRIKKFGPKSSLARERERLIEARETLAKLEAGVRKIAPQMFSPEECQLPAGRAVTRTDRATNIAITLHGRGRRKRCRLTFDNFAIGASVDVQCQPEDVNLTAHLVARGEEALVALENTARPAANKSRAR